jgi:hypothetical protein
MKKYKLSYEYKVEGEIEVEANSIKEAKEKLYEADLYCETAGPFSIKKVKLIK